VKEMETRISTEHLTTREHEEQNVALPESSGRNPRCHGQGASTATAAKTGKFHQTENLIEVVVERQNMFEALRQVKRNKGAAGVDGMTVNEVDTYMLGRKRRESECLSE